MSCAWGLVLTLFLRVSVGTAVEWPYGVYALLKPTTGCPTGWIDKGWIFQDTEDTNPSNNRSETIHIDGHVSQSYVIRSFCIKKLPGNTNRRPIWPDGAYCTYRRIGDTTTTGIIKNGWIQMEDERSYNQDRFVFYSSRYRISYEYVYVRRRLKIKFNCKINQNKKKMPISLPITKPFYLLPYGSRDCQQVEWMVATSEWIKYHTNNNQGSGKMPYHEIGNKGIKMYYCYYESCNYTLTDKKGVFQSPGFPDKYPDGQLCSWRIMVPDNHTLHVHFTNFSLHGNDKKDNLTFFANYSGSFHLNYTLHGEHNRRPFTITATRTVLFVFRTNETGNSTGFRAEYIVFKTPEVTAPPSTKKTNTGIQDTTRLPTTETKNKTNNNTADTFKKPRVGECDEENTAILVVIPLICLIVFIAIAIILLYRWRSRKTIAKCETCASTRYPKQAADAMNPTYDDAGRIPIQQRTSTATINTTMGTDDNDGQMYQALSHDQQPEYEAPDYSKQNGIHDPSTDSELPEYHELEPMDNNVPDVVYDVLEGPDSNDGPSDDQMYQALDNETTQNPLYQSTSPATMVTRNPLYVDSVA